MALIVIGLTSVRAHAQVYSANPELNQNSAMAQLEIRLQQLEEQLRNLTGKVEEQNYTINKLNNQIDLLQQAQQTNVSETKPAAGASQIAIPERDSGNNSPIGMEFKPPALTGIQTATPQQNSAEDVTAQYENAYTMLKSEDYISAQQGFETFLKNNKDHVLAANAKYWLGETYYVQGEFKNAARQFAEGFQTYPDSAKSPDMLLKLGMSLQGMGKTKDACVALSQLPVKFPVGNETVLARGAQEMEKLGCES
ncbi:MAG: tol-pal system protein YbgF [Alphaproteobacteria bacterium]|nr:tol-pal system protein YbgF [Alphaproteobacteria bacterium]